MPCTNDDERDTLVSARASPTTMRTRVPLRQSPEEGVLERAASHDVRSALSFANSPAARSHPASPFASSAAKSKPRDAPAPLLHRAEFESRRLELLQKGRQLRFLAKSHHRELHHRAPRAERVESIGRVRAPQFLRVSLGGSRGPLGQEVELPGLQYLGSAGPTPG